MQKRLMDMQEDSQVNMVTLPRARLDQHHEDIPTTIIDDHDSGDDFEKTAAKWTRRTIFGYHL